MRKGGAGARTQNSGITFCCSSLIRSERRGFDLREERKKESDTKVTKLRRKSAACGGYCCDPAELTLKLGELFAGLQQTLGKRAREHKRQTLEQTHGHGQSVRQRDRLG
jgi:hypothetical protein